jgi:hypothetical protein
VIRRLLKLLALGRVARLGPVGVLVAAYGVWRQLSPEDQQRVLERAKSLLQKARLAWRPEQSPPSASSS